MIVPEHVYRRFVEFEEKAAAIYLRLASRFSEDRQLSSFWLDMAMHEKQHAGLLQFCLREELFAVDLPDSPEIQKLTAFFKQLEKRSADPEITPEEAFLLAIEMENSEINSIYSHLTTTLHPSMYLLRRKIVTSLPNHVDNLIAAARKFGVPDHVLKELTQLKRHSSTWRPRKTG